MNAANIFDDLLLSALAKDALAAMAQAGYQPARDELLARHAARVQNQVSRLARRQRLAGPTLEDLRQEAFLWLMEAIAGYVSGQPPGKPSRSFISFLRRVIAARFQNECRRLRRRAQHEDHSTGAAAAVATAANPDRLHGRRVRVAPDDPAALAVQEELRQGVEAVLGRLPEREQGLVETVQSGRLKAFAAEHGVTVSTARRWRAKLWKKLAVLLGPLVEN